MLFLSTNGCYVGGGSPAKIITFMLELGWLWLIDSTKSGLVRYHLAHLVILNTTFSYSQYL